jgi:hypothetical protein
MASREAALRALHAQADFEVVGMGSKLAAAAARCAEAGQRAHQASAQRAALLAELRRLQGAGAINPAVVGSLRLAYRAALEHERAASDERVQAASAEAELREALAALRHRSRHLERAAQREAASTAAARSASEGARLDDLWLAGHWRTA